MTEPDLDTVELLLVAAVAHGCSPNTASIAFDRIHEAARRYLGASASADAKILSREVKTELHHLGRSSLVEAGRVAAIHATIAVYL